jgi:hypothetical protein
MGITPFQGYNMLRHHETQGYTLGPSGVASGHALSSRGADGEQDGELEEHGNAHDPGPIQLAWMLWVSARSSSRGQLTVGITSHSLSPRATNR